MNTVFTIIHLLIVLGLGWLIAWKLIPGTFLRIVRLLGFQTKMTPITKRRVMRFKRIKRGYWSFRLIVTLFVTSLFLEMIVNGKALMIYYNGRFAAPAVAEWVDKVVFFADISSYEKKDDFGQAGESEVDYRAFARYCDDPADLREDIAERAAKLEKDQAAFEARIGGEPGPDAPAGIVERWERKQRGFAKEQTRIGDLKAKLKVFEEGSAWCLMPLYPFSPDELRDDIVDRPPSGPSFSQGIPLGTDVSGRDVVPIMAYGFRISLAFALLVASIGYTIGIIVGGIQGYFGGWTDIITQRIEEIWGSIPFLFTIMIIASMITPTFLLLIILLVVLRSWLGITYYIRGEFYREKAKDYVQAAIGAGVSDKRIILSHILPNSLVPVVTFAPFGIVAYIGSLVSLDYLGFGLPPGTPSWGALLRQGLEQVRHYPHLALAPSIALGVTLFCVVMVGEAVREAFDPKVFSRLR